MSKVRTCRGCIRYEAFTFAGGGKLYHYCKQGDQWLPCDGNGCDKKETRKNMARIYKINVFRTQWVKHDHTTLMVLDEQDNPIGTAMVEYGGDNKMNAYLWNLQVLKDCRKRGVGNVLLSYAVADANMRGCKDITLEWFKADSQKWVVRWYERNGFDTCEFGDGIVKMKKILN